MYDSNTRQLGVIAKLILPLWDLLICCPHLDFGLDIAKSAFQFKTVGDLMSPKITMSPYVVVYSAQSLISYLM